jgi:hypothetical protein
MSFKNLDISMILFHARKNLPKTYSRFTENSYESRIEKYFLTNFNLPEDYFTRSDISLMNNDDDTSLIRLTIGTKTIVFGDYFDKIYQILKSDMEKILETPSLRFELFVLVKLKNKDTICKKYQLISKNTRSHINHKCSEDEILVRIKTDEKGIYTVLDKSISDEKQLFQFLEKSIDSV